MNMDQELIIRNMVCPRCIAAVKEELDALHIPYDEVTLGHVKLSHPLIERDALREALARRGFELLEDRKSRLVNEIKTWLIDHLFHNPHQEKQNISTQLSDFLGYEYTYLSRLFSSVEGITLEKYVVRLRVEKVKEMLLYGQQTQAEIAFELGYSSNAHLSRQFKNETGMTPTAFRTSHELKRRSLDKLH